MGKWRERLALAPEDVVRKTFNATTQLAMNLEAENRDISRRHYISRFPFLKEKRINDTFHSDIFFLSVATNRGETRSQMFIGRETDYMLVHPMKSESNNFEALQDFIQKVGIPNALKSDITKSEIGTKWTDWCRQYCVNQSFTEPKSPWQNYAEQGINNLGRMAARCMHAFKAPSSRHGWCQIWCKDVQNHLASRKLGWRTPPKQLPSNTPDISVFRFHFWQPIKYYDHSVKQPGDEWLPGQFIGIAESGDSLTYHVETEKPKGRGWNVILVCSTIRPQTLVDHPATSHIPSGEPEPTAVTSIADTSEGINNDEPQVHFSVSTDNSDPIPDDADTDWEEDNGPELEQEDQVIVDERFCHITSITIRRISHNK